MGVFEPLLVLAGIAGVILMFFAFAAVRRIGRTARMLGISAIMAALILFGNRIIGPDRFSNAPQILPPFVNPDGGSITAQAGWQEVPYTAFFLLANLNLDNPAPLPASPSLTPAPSLSPSLSPVSPSPSLSPSLSPASPSIAPSPSLAPAPSPFPIPTTPSPSQSPSPSPLPASPTPAPASPIPAWW